MFKNSRTQYELHDNQNLAYDIGVPMKQEFCGIMKDQTISLPSEIGTGYYRYISPGEYMAMYIGDVTFQKRTILSECTCRDSFTVSFCFSDALEWRNANAKNYIALEKGSCCIYGSGSYEAENYYDAGKRYIGIGLELHPCRFQSAIQCLVENKAVSEFDASSKAVRKFKITGTVESILHQILWCNYKDSLKSLYIEGKMLELASAFTNDIIMERDAAAVREDISRSDGSALFQIRNYIDESYAEPLTITELARKSFMSESKLRAAFKQQFGLTLYQYIMTKRMEKARDMLEIQNCRVKDAASLVGYSNISHFSDAFRKRYGHSPSEHLKIFKK